MIRFTSAMVGIAMLATPTLAGNESRMEYFPYTDGLVEIVADFSENAIYWCGAATYAMSELRDASPKRIYVWQGPSQSRAKQGEKSVKFGFQPPPEGGAAPSYSNSVEVVGNSMSVAQAHQTCNERSASG